MSRRNARRAQPARHISAEEEVAARVESIKLFAQSLPPEKRQAALNAALAILGIRTMSWEEHVIGAFKTLPVPIRETKLSEMEAEIRKFS